MNIEKAFLKAVKISNQYPDEIVIVFCRQKNYRDEFDAVTESEFDGDITEEVIRYYNGEIIAD
jgi:hypothetical protein